MNKFLNAVQAFAREDDGAQVVEYALIIAVVSITLVIALSELNNSNFDTFIDRVGNCLTITNGCT